MRDFDITHGPFYCHLAVLQYVTLVGARYPHSNVRLILNKLDDVIPADSIKKLMARFMGEDGEADAGTVHERMFRTILRDFIGYELRDGQAYVMSTLLGF